MARVADAMAILEEWAWPSWALSWDRVGLQLGDPSQPLTRILVALEATEGAVEEALAFGASLMVVHHPLFFRPFNSLSPARPLGRKITRLLQSGIALYVAHTNLDAAPQGVSWALAQKLGLEGGEVLVPHGEETFLKLVVYVPRGYEDVLLKALGDEGAGVIGRYSHCSFQAPGHGTFLPMEGTRPFLGEVGKLERADEIRLETIVPARDARRLVEVARKVHPYEEMAYDLYPLVEPRRVHGFGWLVDLEEPRPLGPWLEEMATLFGPGIRLFGDPQRKVKRVALWGGAASDGWPAAVEKGADLLICGELSYHHRVEAREEGLMVVELGHRESELPILPYVADRLREGLKDQGLAVRVFSEREGFAWGAWASTQ